MIIIIIIIIFVAIIVSIEFYMFNFFFPPCRALVYVSFAGITSPWNEECVLFVAIAVHFQAVCQNIATSGQSWLAAIALNCYSFLIFLET